MKPFNPSFPVATGGPGFGHSQGGKKKLVGEASLPGGEDHAPGRRVLGLPGFCMHLMPGTTLLEATR